MRLAALALLATALPAGAQMPTTKPGAPDPSRVAAGSYAVDPGHTQVVFTVDHLGFNSYWGIFGGATGTLTLDPANPAKSAVAITVPIDGLVTTVPALNTHLKAPDFFDAAKYPTATFRSTKVTANGDKARVEGDLTLHGVTRPIVIDARFIGAGTMPMKNVATVGFEGTTTVKRSDFGISYGTALVTDEVPLHITAAFEKR